MTLLQFPEGHVAAVRSLAVGRASSVSDRERVSPTARVPITEPQPPIS